MKIFILFCIVTGLFHSLECYNNKNHKVVKLPERLNNSNNTIGVLIKENNELKLNNTKIKDENTRYMNKIEILEQENNQLKEGQAFLISWLVEKLLLNNTLQTSLLHEASQFGHVQVIEVLVQKGVKIDAKDREGSTALHTASWYEKEAIVKTLLDKGANINSKDNEGMTPLHIASTEGYFEIVKILVDRGANVNEKDMYGRMPFDLVCQHPRAIDCDGEAIKNYLKPKEKGKTNQDKDKSGLISLFEASRLGQVQVIKMLLAKGLNVNSNDSDGNTPLHIASREGYLELVKLLVDKGANVNQKNKYGQTAFDITCQNPRAVACNAQAIKDYLKSKETEIGKMLPTKPDKSEVDSLFEASRLGQLNKIKMLLDKGVDVNAKDTEGRTPLHIASIEGRLESVKILVERGANVRAKDKYGMVPFNLICQTPRGSACDERAIKNYLISKGGMSS